MKADIDRGWENAPRLVQRQDSQLFAFVLPFDPRGGGRGGGPLRTELPTTLNQQE